MSARGAAAVLLAAAACRATRVEPSTSRGGLPDFDAQSRALDPRPGDVRLAPDVLVRPLAPGLWLHVTLGPKATGFYPANGVLLETPDSGAVLFDTGWSDAQAAVIADWAKATLRRPVREAVVTHFHEDRLGGTRALRARGARVVATPRTVQLARARGGPVPDSVPDPGDRPRPEAAGYTLFYPGPGHSPDNVVVWFGAQRVLFGGCLVKADSATTVGNRADADVARWPATVARVRETFPAARLVVPGHGAVGGAAALAHTERLIREKGASPGR